MTSPVKGYTNVGFEYSNRHTQNVEKNGGTESTNNIPIFNQHRSNVSTNIEIRAETVEPRFVRRNPESGDLSNDNRYIEILQDYSQVYLMSLGLINNLQVISGGKRGLYLFNDNLFICIDWGLPIPTIIVRI